MVVPNAAQIVASLVSVVASYSLLSRRCRPIQAQDRSATRRRGSTANPCVPGGRATTSGLEPSSARAHSTAPAW